MKDVAIILAANVFALSLVALAAYMMHTGKEYAGWVIVAAVLCHSVPSFDKNDKPTTEKK